MEIIIIVIIAFLVLTIALQARRIKDYVNSVEDLQSSLRARLGNAKFEYNGLASNDALIQELEEIVEIVDDIFDEV